MKTEVKVLTGILLFSLVMLFGAVFLLSKNQPPATSSESTQVYEFDYSRGQKIGSDSAKVKLVEFSDLQCPACKAFDPYVKQVVEKHGNEILFVYKHFPLTQHLNARPAANFAEYAASKGKFWEIHNKLFDTQETWSQEKDPTTLFVQYGQEFGLDEAEIKDAVGKSLYNQSISDQLAEGSRANVDSTPSFYLNGKKLQLNNFSDLMQLIEQEINMNK